MEDYYSFLPRTEDEYLKTRVLDQIQWFDKKSVQNKKWFLYLKIIEIVLSLFIPFLTSFIINAESPFKYIVSLIGIIVAAIAGIVTLVKFNENWIEYRSIAETLKLEKFLFLSKAGPYKNNQEAYTLFVERFEFHIATSTQKWVNYNTKKKEDKDVTNQNVKDV